MKKVLIYLLTFMLLFSFAGCNVKGKVKEKVMEKIFEEVGGGDLDIDGDKIIIMGDEGEKVIFGDSKWPTSGLAKKIPEFKDGTVNGVMETADSIVITLESVQEKDALSYSEKIKKDFPKDIYEMEATDFITISGYNDEGINVVLVYMSETLTITIIAPQ